MTYAGVTYIWGSKGYYQYQELYAYKQSLEKNVERLESYHDELLTSVDQLSAEREAVVLAARKLGYYGEGEGEIVVKGKSGFVKDPYMIGSFMKAFQRKKARDYLLRGIAVCFGLFACMLTWGYRGTGFRKENR